MIFGVVVDEIVGAGVIYFLAGEGFLEVGEAGPGVVWTGALGGDAPKIERFEALSFGI